MTPQEKLAVAREYEKTHLRDIERAAEDGMEILMREVLMFKRKDHTKKYGEQLAIRIDLKDPLLDITEKSQISSYIRQKYRELQVPETIINNISGDLPDEYKNKNLAREQLVTTNGDQLIANTPEIKKLDNLRLQEEDEKLAEEERELRAKLARVRDVKAIVQEEASERHLSLPSMRSQVISTQKPEPQDTKFSDDLIEISNLFMGIAKKVIEFPPNPEDDRKFHKAAQVYIDILHPLTDLKFTKDHRGWLETIKTFEEYGKHAAAVKNAIQTPSGVNRPLTREQVGDRAEEVINAAIAMCNSDPIVLVLSEHHRKYKEPRIGERKVNLHETLSDKA